MFQVCLGVDWAGIELLLAKMETYVARSHFSRVSLGMSCGVWLTLSGAKLFLVWIEKLRSV